MMGSIYAVVSIENTNLVTVTTELNKISGPGWENHSVLGLNIDVENRTSMYLRTKEFIDSHGIEDDCHIPPGLSYANFGVEIDIYAPRNSLGARYIDSVSDALAMHFSKLLHTRSMLWIDDVNTPLFIYRNGQVIHESFNEYEKFYAFRQWRPVWHQKKKGAPPEEQENITPPSDANSGSSPIA